MTGIFLLIPDASLRDAVAEQIAAGKLGAPRVVETVQALLKQSEGETPCVIVIDEAAYDKKTAAALQVLGERAERPALLMLGGADDVEEITESFAKPLRLGHLLTRLRYYIETAPLLRDRAVAFGPYRLEPQSRRVTRDSGEAIRLTEKETALLAFLAGRAEPATRRDILAGVWGYDERIDTHTLETHIYQLRKKLEAEKDSNDNWLIFEGGTYRLAGGQR
jgi:DNA-binding response OmpR family regulator